MVRAALIYPLGNQGLSERLAPKFPANSFHVFPPQAGCSSAGPAPPLLSPPLPAHLLQEALGLRVWVPKRLCRWRSGCPGEAPSIHSGLTRAVSLLLLLLRLVRLEVPLFRTARGGDVRVDSWCPRPPARASPR